MKPADNTKRFFKNAAIMTNPKVDEAVLDEVLMAQEHATKKDSATSGLNMRRIIMRIPITKLAAVVIALVIIIGIIELGKPVAGPSVVFAAAVDSVRRARTFSCTAICDMQYEDGDEHGKYLLKQKLMFKEPDRERHEQLTSAPPWPQDIGKVTIWHYGKRQRLQFSPFDKTAELHDMSSDYTIDEDTGELKLTQLNTHLRDYLLKLSAGAVEDLGKVELDGQSVRMLQSHKDKRITTVWINTATNYPVQIEHKWTDQSRSPVMYTSIQIDTELNDDLFSLKPPEGYTLSVDELGWPDDKKKMMTKVKHLGLWCVVYASDNNGQFPGELADLVTAGIVTGEVLNKVLAAPDEPDGPPAIRYRKPNTAGKNWPTEVILYEIYDQWPDGGIVACFADGHCELIVNRDRFEEAIR